MRVWKLVSAVSASALAVLAFVPMNAAAGVSGGSGQSLCIGHHPGPDIWYNASCTGHDEPEIDPLSNHAGSARDLTWKIVLPTDGGVQVDAVGPTFWIGGTVTDPNSRYGEAFLELQFYPNSIVNNAPNSLVWEIGHTGNYTQPAGQFCLPGSATKPPCYSYDVPTWLRFSPLQVLGVTFGDGSSAKSWSVVSDFGGKAEVNNYCGAANYGSSFCAYPWYAKQSTGAFTYGADYPGTTNDFGQADQFQQTRNCTSPLGGFAQYCSTVIQR